YFLTLAPDLTLEDSGELAIGSYYAGVPHPPGYPVWTLYTWLFTVLVPFSNIAWRVALSSAVAAALASGFLALITSRGSRMILESLDAFKNIDRKAENLICIVAGWVAGTLIAFNGFMWSQAVIVEVYTLSVFTLVLTLVLLLRWLYEPERTRWLVWAFFVFGLCFTNHQTLICAAMGIEVLIAMARPALGRDFLLGNTLAYLGGLFLKATGIVNLFEGNTPVLIIFHVVGILSLGAYCYLFAITRKKVLDAIRDVVGYAFLALAVLLVVAFAKEVGSGRVFLLFLMTLMIGFGCWKLFKATWASRWDFFTPFLSGLCFLGGASLYLYMPLASMTNPPMNWGYPRTVEGFVHAFTRGQYEKTNPTESIGKFIDQIGMLYDGAVSEFTLVYLLFALIPFAFLRLMRRREQAWLIGQVAIYVCLSFLLIYLLNPNADKQSTDLTRVFFTASHVMLAMCAGYGVTLLSSMLVTNYQRYREWLLYGGAAVAAIGLCGVMIVYGMLDDVLMPPRVSYFWLDRFNGWFGFALTLAAPLLVLLHRQRVPLTLFLGLMAAGPLHSVMSHWADNEQRGHLFGWYFGHDMFIPPFTDESGELSYDPGKRRELLADPEAAKLVYPEMTTNAVLFGGTDPGRFAPTYMIFGESFIKPEHRLNPHFDRRDVYIITQNALADHTYLSYIRAHYNRSTQQDPPFFQALLLSDQQRRELSAEQQWAVAGDKFFNKILLGPLDRLFTGIGKRIEEQRREEGVYPPKEIYTPTPLDSKLCFESYLQDAGRRKQAGQLKPGEVVEIVGERIQVAGQVSVMAINALLCQVIFTNNPQHEFFIEESFPLDWMFPHLTPFGIIMKINREPVPEFTEEIMLRDRHFWQQYSERLIGNWITEETTVDQICDFVDEVFIRRDYTNFKGDRKFIRDDQAQKSFSKLRGAIGGTYLWRLGIMSGVPTPQSYLPASEAARARLLREAEFAWKQALAFCPYSPEAVFKYCGMLVNLPGRLPDALRIARTALKMDPLNEQFAYLVGQLESYEQSEGSLAQMQEQFNALLLAFEQNPVSVTAAQALIGAYLQMQQTNAAFEVIDRMISHSNATPDTVIQGALFARDLRNVPMMEKALLRLTEVNPSSPEAWYDLSAMQASLGKLELAATNLRRSLVLSDQRRLGDPAAKDLREEAAKEERFGPLRNRADWQSVIAPGGQ
ncbi:MAG TPA: DUF2723 domain-containing protein, partial [Verrucomicrobiales bacterium]|nr:DUF2723 domain-containing protein [Verrucomicrobiales bacterium]